MENDGTEGLIIGRDIPWEEVVGHGFRVEHFLPLAQVVRGKIKEDVKFIPYASLRVDCPAFKYGDKEVLLPVLHKVDFRHLWELYKERGVDEEEEEVIVEYRRQSGWRKLFGKSFPHLYITARPKGSLEEIYRMDELSGQEWREMVERVRAIAKWEPGEGRTL